MHFLKAVVLFAGIAAAAPTSSSVKASATPSKSVAKSSSAAPSKTSSAAVKVAAASSKAASVSSKAASASASAVAATAPSASQVAVIKADLTAFDSSMTNAIKVLGKFVGGTNATAQGQDVTNAGLAWQSATDKLLKDAQALPANSHFTTTDSTAIQTQITGTIITDLNNLYAAVVAKKDLFINAGAKDAVRGGLYSIANNIKSAGDAIGAHLQSADVTAIQNAATKNDVTAKAVAAINAFA